MDENRLTVTVEEFAERMGIGRSGAYEAIKRGEIQVIRIGKRIVISRKVLERMLDGQGHGRQGQ